MADDVLNQVSFLGVAPSFVFVVEMQTNGAARALQSNTGRPQRVKWATSGPLRDPYLSTSHFVMTSLQNEAIKRPRAGHSWPIMTRVFTALAA